MSHHGSSPRFIREISVFASRHLTPKQLIFTLALLVGVGSAIAAWVLKTLIEEIALLLTSHFDVTSA
ncbi:MAG: chloride channel protein, partial [Bacteroidales bacterium]|nr:chloride channel protein [Bacteroidales bacterium]